MLNKVEAQFYRAFQRNRFGHVTPHRLTCSLCRLDDRIQNRFGNVVIDFYGIRALTNQEVYGAFSFLSRIYDNTHRRGNGWTSVQHIARIEQTRPEFFTRFNLLLCHAQGSDVAAHVTYRGYSVRNVERDGYIFTRGAMNVHID